MLFGVAKNDCLYLQNLPQDIRGFMFSIVPLSLQAVFPIFKRKIEAL